MGNTRLSYFHNGSSIEVLEENNYYPFGLKHDGYNTLNGNPAYNYKYNGKELQEETGMYDYGARFYMPDIGRWGVIDPLAEQSRAWTPYRYAYNNPLRFTDPDGRIEKTTINDMMSQGGSWTNTGRGFSNGGGSFVSDYFRNDFWTLPAGASGMNRQSPFELGIGGAYAQAAFDLLKQAMSSQLDLKFEKGIVTGSAIEGVELTPAAAMLLEAINNPKIKVSLDAVGGLYYYDSNIKNHVYFEGDAFLGSFVYNGKTTATNKVSPSVIEAIDSINKSPVGTSMIHAALEAYIGGNFPGAQSAMGRNGHDISYIIAHDWATCLDINNMRNLPSNYRFKSVPTTINGGLMKSDTPYIFDKKTGEIIYQFPTFKY